MKIRTDDNVDSPPITICDNMKYKKIRHTNVRNFNISSPEMVNMRL